MKYISAKSARKQTRGVAAVFSALVLTLLTAATGVVVYCNADYIGMAVPILLGINAVGLWATVFSKKTVGLGIVRTIKIIELVALTAAAAAAAVLLVDSLSQQKIVENIVWSLGGTEIVDVPANQAPAFITALAAAVFLLIYRITALGALSAASRAYKGRNVGATGKAFASMSNIIAIGLLMFIPLRITFDSFAALIDLNTAVFSPEKISLDFASYGLKEIAVLVISVLAPVFYFLVSFAAKRLSASVKDEPDEKEETDAEPAESEEEQVQPCEPEQDQCYEPAAAVTAAAAVMMMQDDEAAVQEEICEETVCETEEVIEDTSEEFAEDVAEVEDEPAEVIAEPGLVEVSEIAETQQELYDDAADEFYAEGTVTEIEVTSEEIPEEIPELAEPTIAEPAEPNVRAEASADTVADCAGIPAAAPVIGYFAGTHLLDFGYSENTII